MTELQTEQENTPVETTESPEQEANAGSELAPDSGENREDKQGEGVQAAINKQHKKYRDEERAHQETKRKLDEYEAQLQELRSAQVNEPVIPPRPDPFDDDFDERLAARDEAIARKAQFDSQQQIIAQAEQQAQQERLLAQQRQAAEQTQTLLTNATKHGVKEDDLVQAAQVVGEYRLPQEIINDLMVDADGPLIIAHLAANPVELDNLRSMSVVQAVRTLDGSIRAKANALKQKTSEAPEPPEILRGGGTPEEKNTLKSGVKFQLE